MYVRLADGAAVQQQRKPDEDLFPFVYIPQLKTYVREDYLDDLDDNEWRVMMAQLALVQPEVTSGQKTRAQFMSDRATRKAARETKDDDKHKKSAAKTAIKEAKAEKKKSGKGSDILGSVIDGVGGLLGKKAGGTATVPPDDTDDKKKPDDKPEKSVPFYATTGGQIGIAVGSVALIGGILYAVNKKRN